MVTSSTSAFLISPLPSAGFYFHAIKEWNLCSEMEQIYADAESTSQKQRLTRVWRHHTFRQSLHSSLYASIHVENMFIGVMWDKTNPCGCCTCCEGSNLPINAPDLDLKGKLTVVTKWAWSLRATFHLPPQHFCLYLINGVYSLHLYIHC